MPRNEEILEQYLKTNHIKMDQTKIHIQEKYMDADIEAWYKANKIEGPTKALKNLKMEEKIRNIKEAIAKKGSKTLGVAGEIEKHKLMEKTSEKIGEKPRTHEEKKKEQQEYLNKLIKLHEEKTKIYAEQRRKDKLVPTDRELIFMIRLQQEINIGKSKYEREYGTEELNKLVNKNFKEEIKDEKKILEDHQKKIDRLEELNNELDEILAKVEALEYQMTKGQMSIDDYENEKELLQKAKVNKLWDINEMDPAILAEEERQYEDNEKFKNRVLGSDFDNDQRENLNAKNYRDSKGLEETKNQQKGTIEKANEDMEDSHKQSIINKENAIEELKIKLVNTTDEKQIVLITEQIAKLEEDKHISNEQQKMATGKDEVSYSEIENPPIIKENLLEDLEKAMEDFKDTIEKQDELKEEIAPDSKKETNPFILEMQGHVKDIGTDVNAAKEYLQVIERTTLEAKEYNKDLQEGPSIK